MIIVVLLFVFTMVVLIFVYYRTRISGRYYSQDNMLINYIEFSSKKSVKFNIMGKTTLSLPYKKRGDIIRIYVPTKGQTLYRVIDRNTIQGETSGFDGTFIKNKEKINK